MEQVHIFAGDPLDRADAERRDPAWIDERLRHPDSRFLAFRDMQVLVRAGPPPALAWQGPGILRHASPHATPVLLGTLDDIAHFGLDVSDPAPGAGGIELPPGVDFEDARGVAPDLPLAHSGMLAHAKSVVDWHARHRFCANCGAATVPRHGGKERWCESCDAHHFPRTDPVVIMLVHDGERCLLGRSRRRVTGNYSALAGFVDQGESIEAAVRREVWEEAGIRVGAVRYHSSQPWPFPSSLMIGCIAVAATTRIDMDEREMADVRWFGRDEVLVALATAGQPVEGLRLPGPIAIAHHIIRDWANGA